MDKARLQELRAELDRLEAAGENAPFAGFELCQLLRCEYPATGATDLLPDRALNLVLDERQEDLFETTETDEQCTEAHRLDHERLKRHSRILQLVIWILEDVIEEDLM